MIINLLYVTNDAIKSWNRIEFDLLYIYGMCRDYCNPHAHSQFGCVWWKKNKIEVDFGVWERKLSQGKKLYRMAKHFHSTLNTSSDWPFLFSMKYLIRMLFPHESISYSYIEHERPKFSIEQVGNMSICDVYERLEISKVW